MSMHEFSLTTKNYYRTNPSLLLFMLCFFWDRALNKSIHENSKIVITRKNAAPVHRENFEDIFLEK